MTNRYSEAIAKLDKLTIEGFCDHIIDGKTYIAIARDIGVSKASLVHWLASDPDRAARARAARELSSQTFDEMSEDVLRDNTLDPAIRRELASHYRWRASKIAPREYGDKLQIDQKTEIINLSSDEIARQRAEIQRRIEAAKAAALPPPDAEGSTP